MERLQRPKLGETALGRRSWSFMVELAIGVPDLDTVLAMKRIACLPLLIRDILNSENNGTAHFKKM
jgi:hypothetical protein